MWVVIFRARVRSIDDDYARLAGRLRDLALSQFGCLEFVTVNEGRDEVTLSYWPSEESIRACKQHSEHVLAQELGRARWYESFGVQVACIQREYHWSASSNAKG